MKKMIFYLVVSWFLVGCTSVVATDMPVVVNTRTPEPVVGTPLSTQTPYVVTSTPLASSFTDEELAQLTALVVMWLDQLTMPEGCATNKTYVLANQAHYWEPELKIDLLVSRSFLYTEDDPSIEGDEYCGSIAAYLFVDHLQALVEYEASRAATGQRVMGSGGQNDLLHYEISMAEKCDEDGFCIVSVTELVNYRYLGDGLNLVIEYWLKQSGKVDFIDPETNQ